VSAGVAPVSPTPAPRPGEDLASIDWRFLLSHPWPERVACIGTDVPPALRQVSQVETIAASGASSSKYSVVVVRNPGRDELARATQHVVAGGSLVVEVHAPSRGRRKVALGRVAQELRAMGFVDVRRHWHWPDLERCTRLVPLAHATPVRNLLARAGGGVRGRIQALAGEMLWNLGLLDRMVYGTVIATRSGAPSSESRPTRERADSFVHRFLSRHRESGTASNAGVGPQAPFLALTPRFRNSSHLVFLLFAAGADSPAIAVKLARRAGPSPALDEEAARLRSIHALRSGGFDSIPQVIACEVFEGHALLAETALAGHAMDPARVRADTPGCCAAIVDWMMELQRHSRRDRAGSDPWIRPRVERDLAELRSAGLADAAQVEATLGAVSSLAEYSIPTVLEHGDLSHPNILVRGSGAASVLDWELSDSNGLPATDLFFFLAYVARARAQSLVGPPAASAIVDAFASAPEWLHAPIARYRDGLRIPDGALRGLFMACWVTQAAGVVRRAPAEVRNAGRDGELHDDWRVDVWRRVAANAGRFFGGA
jgi:aminoglycoside phosphotransferase (APT) family kinase protein